MGEDRVREEGSREDHGLPHGSGQVSPRSSSVSARACADPVAPPLFSLQLPGARWFVLLRSLDLQTSADIELWCRSVRIQQRRILFVPSPPRLSLERDKSKLTPRLSRPLPDPDIRLFVPLLSLLPSLSRAEPLLDHVDTKTVSNSTPTPSPAHPMSSASTSTPSRDGTPSERPLHLLRPLLLVSESLEGLRGRRELLGMRW